ncbi:T9SS type A sorting domain-containing protein [Fodinibius sp.]|uniref:T9SS type A sorting domain-containing protein n=1 Tax=Fodinibius sp. TaxID=1872440 RepID=UPI002ACDE70C|nr:T9SS type A sorting domain-containing protein [Fodinibius sp.]MDZ7657972.1 T9SS type A sorting domain-containing protein [Fodinibius sp.]
MRKNYRAIAGLVVLVLLGAGIWYIGLSGQDTTKVATENTTLDPVEKKKARTDYFFNLLRDPATNSIPPNIRSRELNHAKQLPGRNGGLLRKSGTATAQAIGDITWNMAGPTDLGGRTRALAFDQDNPNTILAGGVSGGMWKSTDGGSTWQLKTDPNQNMSVSSVAQDPTNPDTWYYATGEFRGNTASDRGGTASYFGTGIYKSTDNGETWSRLAATEDTDAGWNTQFDFISRIVVNPTNGDVYFAANGFGVFKSSDEGGSFNLVFGGPLGAHRYVDIIVNGKGELLAALSENSASSSATPNNSPGLYRSTDDGNSWTDVTPADFPATHDRTYLAFAPSAPDTAYSYTYEGSGSGSDEDISFFIHDFANDDSEDRSANLPDFGDPVGFVNTQFNYNMVLRVKPDNPDFVLLGATNLFRSQDGFATAPEDADNNGISDDSEKDEYWIGGYAKSNNVSQYPNHHPDQHVLAFHPNDPNTMWSGHDGGLSKTTDITASSVSWEDTDEGYVTGQFYTVAIPSAADDDRIMGGTQDNGTPFYRFSSNNQQTTEQIDVSSGDGSYAFWGTDYAFVSSQNGTVLRLGIESDGSITSPFTAPSGSWSRVQPANAQNQLFIHPYAIDPNDETIMYYPGGTEMWRNTEIDQIPDGNSAGATTGWESFEGTSSSGYTISTLEVTSLNPSNRLYYGASSGSGIPEIFRLDDASNSDMPTDISISDASSGAYVHDIAVNPYDGDELIAVLSNYNIVGLYHSADGGENWTAIEGNLEGDSQNPGPSIRNAEILPTEEGNLYLVGTSTGVYSTMTLEGGNTNWIRESDDGSPASIGYSVAEYIMARPSDGTIAVGTHGRGIFVGRTDVGNIAPDLLPMVEETLDVNNSWQLVGSPMASDSDVEPGNDLQLFEFSGTYKSASDITSHNGYWAKSRSGSEIVYNGRADTSATIALEEGWNLIGGVADTVGVSAINDPNGILSASDIFEFVDGSYQAATDIKSLQGYWIQANQAGEIEIAPESSSGKTQPLIASNQLGRITFSIGNAKQQFYISEQPLSKTEREQFMMPPMAPEAVLDVRSTEGLRVAEGSETELQFTASSYPVTVSGASSNRGHYIVKGITGRDTVYYDVTGNAQTQIQHPHEKMVLTKATGGIQITEHNLLPNYPNPFNPETQIRYQVASQAQVTLEVYDVLGRKVRTLVDEPHAGGSYTVSFDGSNLSSGMYFIHLKAGQTVKLQKMTLIK